MFPVRITHAILVFLLAALTGFAAAQDTKFTQDPDKNVWDYISQNPEHTMMTNAFRRLELDVILTDHLKGICLIAPFDKAIERADPSLLEKVRNDDISGTTLAAHHALKFRVNPADLVGNVNRVVIPTYSDDDVVFIRNGNAITVDGIPVVEVVELSNGWVYRIDDVMLPASLKPQVADSPRNIIDIIHADPELTRFAAGLDRARLAESLAAPNITVTVFAPTDEAFEKIPEDTRLAVLANPDYFRRVAFSHFLNTTQKTGALRRQPSLTMMSFETMPVRSRELQNLQIGIATIVQGDIEATNGVIHKIDTVMIPPSVANAVARELREKPSQTTP